MIHLKGARRQNHRYWRIYGLLALCLIVAVAGWWLISTFSGASQGTITAARQSASSAVYIQPPATLTGRHFLLTYPGDFHTAYAETPISPVLENYSLVKNATPTWTLTVQIAALPSGNLQDDGSYHFRSITPERFHQTVIMLNNSPVYIMSDNDAGVAFAKAAFMVRDGIVATLALTGGSSTDLPILQTDFNKLLAGWVWR